MKLYTYVLDHDFGFAPNPFQGVCTLATCKPQIRARAPIGAYIVGTGCAKRGRQGRLVYFMKVDEDLTFDQYWSDDRFASKRPNLRSSRARAFGDNIYHHKAGTAFWSQEPSFHSMPDGSANQLNVNTDTGTDRVLIGRDFAYWGGEGPQIPGHFRDYNGADICAGRAYKTNFPEGLAEEFIGWIRGLAVAGRVGEPADWARMKSGI